MTEQTGTTSSSSATRTTTSRRTPTRKNYINTFKFVVNSNADDIFAKVQSGAYQDEVSSPAPKTIRLYATTPSLKPRMIPNVGDRTNYLSMNLTQPPFDDIHVRKAMNWIMDKAELQKAWGGPIPGSIATHIVPPVLFNNGLAEYDPYGTPNNAGDLAKAQAEMKLSKYDPGKTGKCTASLQGRADDRRHTRRRHAHGPDHPG